MRRIGIRFLAAALIAWLALAGCASSKSAKTSETAATTTTTTGAPGVTAQAAAPTSGPREVTLSGGLKYVDLKVGDGAIAENGMDVSVHYTGWLTDGTRFDGSEGGQPLSFRLGSGQVIRGWEDGIRGMRVGGKRKLTIPPAMGYGDRGTPGGPIPPNATLVFDVELMGVR
jgi:FKBP-type peptidyl-prolyl cis-trans isomerase